MFNYFKKFKKKNPAEVMLMTVMGFCCPIFMVVMFTLITGRKVTALEYFLAICFSGIFFILMVLAVIWFIYDTFKSVMRSTNESRKVTYNNKVRHLALT